MGQKWQHSSGSSGVSAKNSVKFGRGYNYLQLCDFSFAGKFIRPDFTQREKIQT